MSFQYRLTIPGLFGLFTKRIRIKHAHRALQYGRHPFQFRHFPASQHAEFLAVVQQNLQLHHVRTIHSRDTPVVPADAYTGFLPHAARPGANIGNLLVLPRVAFTAKDAGLQHHQCLAHHGEHRLAGAHVDGSEQETDAMRDVGDRNDLEVGQ